MNKHEIYNGLLELNWTKDPNLNCIFIRCCKFNKMDIRSGKCDENAFYVCQKNKGKQKSCVNLQ